MNNAKTNFYWYSNRDTIIQSAQNMIAFGAEHFKRAYVITHLKELREVLLLQERQLISANEFQEFMQPFIFEKLIDLFKICLFFENYMKAVLIKRDFLIHKINPVHGCEALAKIQMKEPVTTMELHDLKNFDINEQNDIVYHGALSSQTLTIGMLLHKIKYSQVIGLPDPISNLLNELVEKRNELHFISEWKYEVSLSFVEQLEAANTFVDSLFAKV